MDDSPFASPLAMTVLYGAVNALIMLILGMLVVRARVKTRTEIGDGADPALLGPLRAHGNNAEYVPMAIVLLILLASVRSSVLVIHLVGGSLTLGRLLHAIGLSRSVGPSALRLIGMVLTWLSYIIAIAVLLWLVLVGG
jgi:uncharacterized membrane protein YecN with MAPEG domain